jgi:hypothetical protein
MKCKLPAQVKEEADTTTGCQRRKKQQTPGMTGLYGLSFLPIDLCHCPLLVRSTVEVTTSQDWMDVHSSEMRNVIQEGNEYEI